MNAASWEGGAPVVIPESDDARDAMTPGRWARFAAGHVLPLGLANAFLSVLEYGTDEGVSMSLGKRHGGER